MDALPPQNTTIARRDLFTIYEGVESNTSQGETVHTRVQVVATLIRRNEKTDVNIIEAEHERKMHEYLANIRETADQIKGDEAPFFIDGDYVIIDAEAVRNAIQNTNSGVEESKTNPAV